MSDKASSWFGVEPFEYDVFISYAHLDDVSMDPDAPRGWVSYFFHALNVSLEANIGSRDISVFFDPKLGINSPFSDQLQSALQGSVVLVPILSPGYNGSEWCKRELDTFLAAAAQTGDGDKRVFPVVKAPVPIPERDPLFQNQLGIDFFKQDELRTTLLDPQKTNTKEEFYTLVGDLSLEICNYLKRFQALKKGVANPVSSHKGRVFLTETVPRLQVTRERLKRDLEDRGYLVIPDPSEPWKPDQSTTYEDWVKRELSTCNLAVQLVPNDAAETAVGGHAEKIRCQHETVERWSGKSELLDNTSIEELKTRMLDHLSADHITKSKSQGAMRVIWREPGGVSAAPVRLQENEVKATETPGNTVYLICDDQDREYVDPIASFLFENGVDVQFPAFGGADGQTRDEQQMVSEVHRQRMLDAEGFLIYYGFGSDAWLECNLTELGKAEAQRAKDVRAKLVFLGHPPLPVKEQKFKFQRRIKWAGDASHLIPFIDDILGKSGEDAHAS